MGHSRAVRFVVIGIISFFGGGEGNMIMHALLSNKAEINL